MKSWMPPFFLGVFVSCMVCFLGVSKKDWGMFESCVEIVFDHPFHATLPTSEQPSQIPPSKETIKSWKQSLFFRCYWKKSGQLEGMHDPSLYKYWDTQTYISQLVTNSNFLCNIQQPSEAFCLQHQDVHFNKATLHDSFWSDKLCFDLIHLW